MSAVFIKLPADLVSIARRPREKLWFRTSGGNAYTKAGR
jgi:hypothetical protein